MKLGLIVVLIAAAGLVGGWIRHQHKNFDHVSCEQNTGPFVDTDAPNVSKDQLKIDLTAFYLKCLKPGYSDGYQRGSLNGNSESQAYALWQSYLAGDKKTFDKVLKWTDKNLQRPQDHLMAWKFEADGGGKITQVKILDQNSATDADTDMAYVLLRAGSTWKNQEYLDQGRGMLLDIWDKETAEISGKRYITAGNWASDPKRAVINLSYFSPQALRTFALFDGTHDWNKVVKDNYELLAQGSTHDNFIMPVNWISVDRQTGNITSYPDKSDARDYSFDAFRSLWRVSLDQLNTPSFASWNYISSIKSFENDWHSTKQVCALYKFNNNDYTCDHSTTSTLAGPLSVFSVTNGYIGGQLISKYYIRDGKLEFPDTDFYAKSWHWFGAWLWANS